MKTSTEPDAFTKEEQALFDAETCRICGLRFDAHDGAEFHRFIGQVGRSSHMRVATTRCRDRKGAERLVRRCAKAGGSATIHRRNRQDGTYNVTYVLPPEVTASDVGVCFDIIEV